MAAVGLALIAAPMLLTMQFAALSNRPAVTLDHALLGSLHPADLAQLVGRQHLRLAPDRLLGPERRHRAAGRAYRRQLQLSVRRRRCRSSCCCGSASPAAARSGAAASCSPQPPALALLYALGRYTPLFAWAFDWVPGVSRFRRPVDGNFVFMAALALLCGHLLADYIREGVPRGRLLASIAVAFVRSSASSPSAGIVFSARAGHCRRCVRSPRSTSAPIAARRDPDARARARRAHARRCRHRGDGDRRRRTGVVERRRSASMPSRARYYAVLEQPVGRCRRGARSGSSALCASASDNGERPRVEIMGLGGPWQNLAMVRSLEAINGYNPLRIGYLRPAGVARRSRTGASELRDFPASFDSYDCALARTLGLEFVLLGRPIEEVPHLARRPVADVLRAGPTSGSIGCSDPAPRLKFTRRVQVADADAVSGPGWLAASPSPDRVLIDDDTPPTASYAGAMSARAARASSAWRPDRIEIDVELGTRRRAGAARDLVSGLGRRDRRQARRRSCAPTCCSAGSKCRPAAITWCSASRRSRSTISPAFASAAGGVGRAVRRRVRAL